MYRYSREIGRMASQLGVNYQMAVGIFAIMKEMDKDGDLDSISSGVFWMELGGKIRGQTKESLIRLYVEVNVGQKRKKEREKKRTYRSKCPPKKVDTDVDKEVDKEKESASPLDGPLPPVTPNPPIIPPTRERDGVTPPKPTDGGFAPGRGNARKDGAAVRRFVKPGVEEVRAYCLERRNRVDAQKFVDYYESNGWRVGRNPMKDWKAAVRTWERNSGGRSDDSKRGSDEVNWR